MTAVAAAGVGAVAVFGATAGSVPAASSLAMAGGARQQSSSLHTTSALFDWVDGLRWPGAGAQSGSRDGSASTLTKTAHALAQRASTHSAGATRVATHPAAAKPPVVHAHAAPSKPAQPAHPAAPAPPPKPFLFYDSVDPASIPADQQVATYADGGYAVSPSAVAGRGHVLWIDTNGSDPSAAVLDVEPGCANPWQAAPWVEAKLNADRDDVAILYTFIDDWQAVRDSVATLPQWMQSRVRYWIADPTGVPHVVPGANATQWYWGNSYDISTANPGFESS